MRLLYTCIIYWTISHLTLSRSRTKLPTMSLMKMIEKEKLKVAMPTPVNLPSERGPLLGEISLGGPLESSKDKASDKEHVTDYFADELN